MKDRVPGTPSVEDWLASTLSAGDVVGIDATVTPLASAQRLQAALEKRGIKVDATPRRNVVDEVWGEEQPAQPAAPVTTHPLALAGASSGDKIARVQEALKAEGAGSLVVTALDEVAWLFNIRGGDVECNPVTLAYAVVHAAPPAGAAAPATLYIDAGKLSPAVRHHLAGHAEIKPYEALWGDLPALPGKVWVDPSFCNYAVFQALEARKDAAGAAVAAPAPAAQVLQRMSPLQLMKAVKNAVEMQGMRNAHERDAVALVSFFAWLEGALKGGVDARTGGRLDFALTEYSVSDVLESFRAAQERFVGLSFPTIAGMGPNGAIIHYRPEKDTAAPVTADGVFLCDSGAQYLDGTTDVTRTLHFGTPSAHERRCFTRVLQGHIALARARFPTGVSGVALDALARAPLWEDGLDYRHGTGHGVGAFLNVHEGPYGIATAARTSYEGGAQAGFVLSNEPGYYEDGAFGVRIENLVAVVPAATPCSFGDKPYLGFDNLTLVPMCRALIDTALLSPADVAYLNAYHAAVRDRVAPRLSEWARPYLLRETEPL
jgi:Xaa-Pro aminopeptidase